MSKQNQSEIDDENRNLLSLSLVFMATAASRISSHENEIVLNGKLAALMVADQAKGKAFIAALSVAPEGSALHRRIERQIVTSSTKTANDCARLLLELKPVWVGQAVPEKMKNPEFLAVLDKRKLTDLGTLVRQSMAPL